MIKSYHFGEAFTSKRVFACLNCSKAKKPSMRFLVYQHVKGQEFTPGKRNGKINPFLPDSLSTLNKTDVSFKIFFIRISGTSSFIVTQGTKTVVPATTYSIFSNKEGEE